MSLRPLTRIFLPLLLSGLFQAAFAQGTIVHQISLPTGMTWCDDSMINDLLNQVNTYRAENNVAALAMNSLGMKDAEIRATQFATYMATNQPGEPGFNPHQGYDTTAASLGYNLVSENLAYLTSSAAYVVFAAWQDPLHIAAMLASDANVAGVSCVFSQGIPYWTYEPGIASGGPSPSPSPTAATPDSEGWAFLTLINNYRAQNGAGPLQVSAALENAATWMSNDMATNNFASHTDSLGRSSGARLLAFGYPYTPWGENLAGGFSDAQNTFSQWQTACDPDASGNCTFAHRQAMLYPGFVVIGIARAFGPNSAYGWYWTTDFGGVLDATISPNQTSAPVINSFQASPLTIAAGQTATLAWSISGATSVSIDNGVGDVSGATSKTVSPLQTTTYTLTASNGSGTASARATVTVNAAPPPIDTQPPTAPSITSVIAKSATEVDLAWSASSDNVGVSGYQVLRNGSLIKTVSGGILSIADTTAAANTTYSYVVKGFDAAGNTSASSNAVQVTTPAPPSNACPGPSTGAFTGCYYNNATLSGPPAMVRTDAQINFDWRFSSPGPSINGSNFSVLWQGAFTFSGGAYTFTVLTSDGMRIYIDGNVVLDRWRNQAPTAYNVQQTLSQGSHLIAIEYYQQTGSPVAQVSWQGGAASASPPVISSFTASPATISPGQSTTLAWNVAGATSISINNGVGDVSNVVSKMVLPSQTTTYTLTAMNATGTSVATVSVVVASSTPPSGGCPGPASGTFTGCYFNNTTLTGNPVLVRTDPQINFNWQFASPDPSVNGRTFSVRWLGNFTFNSGTYVFNATASDGLRVYLDGNLVLDRWRDEAPTMYRVSQGISAGTHQVTVEYYEQTGSAVAQVVWQQTQ